MTRVKDNKENLIKTIFYVDPMSYSNLALYDYSLLSNIKGVDLHYYCNTKYDSKELNTKIDKIYRYSDKKGLFKIISYFKSQLVLLKAITKFRPDMIHFQWLKIPSIDYILLKRIKNKGVKTILTAHNILPHDTGNKYESIYKKIYFIVDAIIVHANNTKKELIDKFQVPSQKIHVIPHGILDIGQNIDREKFDYHIKKFKTEFELKDKMIFSAPGTINDYKGYDLIVDAWKQDNLSENQEIKLIIAGKGEHKKIEEIRNTDNVVLMNKYLSVEEFLAILKLTDYVLLPYKKISQSGILLTALSERKKVIVSDVGGLTDPFEFGNIGYILSEISAKELNKVIIKASSNENALTKEETWQKIFNYYDWVNFGIKTQELYNSLTIYNKC